MGWALEEVERPLVEQLAGLGRRQVTGDIAPRHPHALNLHGAQSWLDEGQH